MYQRAGPPSLYQVCEASGSFSVTIRSSPAKGFAFASFIAMTGASSPEVRRAATASS
jgi:hypothetical protein